MPTGSETASASLTVFEGMTSLSAVLKAYGSTFNDRKIEKVLYDGEKASKLTRELHFLKKKSNELHFPLQKSSADEISAYTTGSSHGGIIAFCTSRALPALSAEDILPDGFYVYLEGIEDPYNFGYTLRSLYAAGVDGVLLSPRNWMSAAGVVARSSAGASELLPLYIADDSIQTVGLFHTAGYTVYAAGIRDSLPLYQTSMKKPLLLIVGGEKRGISRTLLDKADHIVRIDYGRPFLGSLSAASAATVMAFEIMRQNLHQ